MYTPVELDTVDHQQYPLDGDDGKEAEDSLIENARLVGFEDGVIGDLDEIVPHDSVYGSVPQRAGSMPRGSGSDAASNQLTLSFRGQVYVFDDITADKVQEVLLLLGGCEYTPGPNGTEMPYQNPRGFPEYTGRCNDPRRLESLNRFRQKRKERCFEKKIRYSVRHEVALKMQRKKGQFAPRNADGSITSDAVEESRPNDSPPETSCTHCGASSKSTPMMRKGPSGPRTLCNACGLFWANKGTLRSLPKKPVDVVAVTGEEAVIGTEDDGDSDSELGIPHASSQKNVDALPAGKNSATQAQL